MYVIRVFSVLLAIVTSLSASGARARDYCDRTVKKGVDSPLPHKVSVAKAEAVFALHIRARACRRHSAAAIGVETRGI